MRPLSPHCSIVVLSLITLNLFSTRTGHAEPPSTARETAPADSTVSVDVDVATTTDPPALRTFPLPPNVEVRRQFVGLDGAAVVTAGGEGKLVYSNTRGAKVVSLTPLGIIADDLTLLAPSGCGLVSYSFQIIGTAEVGVPGGAFRVDYALYDNCPSAGGKSIAGTAGFVEYSEATHGPAFDTVIYEVVVLPSAAVALNSTVWMGLKPNRSNVGVVIGTPAEIGFSGDRVDYPGFVYACNATAGGFPLSPHASFNATVFVDPACPDAYPAFRNSQPGRAGFTEGTNKCLADDIELNVGDCEMIAYAVNVRGVGVFKFDFREDAKGVPGAVIPGTAKTRAVPTSAGTGTQNLRFLFDPPIALPPKVWLTFQGNNPAAGWVLTGRDADVGDTQPTYARSVSGAGCDLVDDWEAVNPYVSLGHGGFDVTITCAGSPPIGACCDMYILDETGESVCREVPAMNCPTARLPVSPNPPVLWVHGAACHPDPFVHACGLSACCKPDETCENLTQNECAAQYLLDDYFVWSRLHFCEDEDLKCPFYRCLGRTPGECGRTKPDPGCENPFCCREVGEVDSWCVHVEWDTVCLRQSLAAPDCEIAAQNDPCGPTEHAYDGPASLIETNTSVMTLNGGSVVDTDPGFGCHNGLPDHCEGGPFDGQSCEDDSDCECFPNQFGCVSGTCALQTPLPGEQGYRTLWFRFVATDASARVSTCETSPGVDQTIIGVYRPDDPSPLQACDTLVPIGCNDDSSSCGTGLSSEVCVEGLIPGDTYYIQLANTWDTGRGVIQLDLESPCPAVKATDQATSVTAMTSVTAPLRPRESHDKSDGDVAFSRETAESPDRRSLLREVPNDPPMPRPATPPAGAMAHAGPWVRGPYVSVQVNVDADGNNIVGDAANGPSIAVNTTNPDNIVIGWRQFDNLGIFEPQAGYAYSNDGGADWTFPGPVEPGVTGMDPVLASGPDGVFYFFTRQYITSMRLYRSRDAGVHWEPSWILDGIVEKPWMTVDNTTGIGRGNLYIDFGGSVERSVDEGASFPHFGRTGIEGPATTTAVGPDGVVYTTNGYAVARSRSAQDSMKVPEFVASETTLRGTRRAPGDPNPYGYWGRPWICVDSSDTGFRGDVYVLDGFGTSPIGGVIGLPFIRSRDGGESWGPMHRVDDDPAESLAWHWFGTMSVAPSGRIDVTWNDTRNSGVDRLSETHYAYSVNGGHDWSPIMPDRPKWVSWIGQPHVNNKIGDYYHMVSDDHHAKLAYAATFNGEQDVYFLKIPPTIDCNNNGTLDADDLAQGASADCSGNGVPDECEPDFDGDGIADSCDEDVDGDEILNAADVCLFTTPGTQADATGRPVGDTNKNCKLDLVDYWRFRNCMVNGRLGAPAPREACLAAFDANGDEHFDLVDAAAFQRSFGGEP